MNKALILYVSERASQPMIPGKNDCALFQADCHMLLTGVDLAARWRGKYSTFREGLALLRAEGFRHHRDAFESVCDPVSPGLEREGDLCFNGLAGGVVVGSGAYMLHNRCGLAYVPLNRSLKVFRVVKWQA